MLKLEKKKKKKKKKKTQFFLDLQVMRETTDPPAGGFEFFGVYYWNCLTAGSQKVQHMAS